MNSSDEKAPLTAKERVLLRRNAADVKRTAVWKGFAVDNAHIEIAERFARDYFTLGCWLYYYSFRIHRRDNLDERIDCASRLFEAGFSDPGDYFLLIFGFGKGHFTALFRDGDTILDALARKTGSENNIR